MENPDIKGIEYQQGTLAGYEVREYLLEKRGRKCAYCGAKNVPLERDHIHPKSRGGTDRVSNLTLACHACNQEKGNQDVREFLAERPEVMERVLAQAKAPRKGLAAVNSTRWTLFNRLKKTILAVEAASAGQTKWNRLRLGIQKKHALDAACVGCTEALSDWQRPILSIKAMGRGSYRRTQLTRHGLPRGYLSRQKRHFGFQTGDMVRAVVLRGLKAGNHTGRVAVRAIGSFDIQTFHGVVQGVSHRFCRLEQRGDGYGYHLVGHTRKE